MFFLQCADDSPFRPLQSHTYKDTQTGRHIAEPHTQRHTDRQTHCRATHTKTHRQADTHTHTCEAYLSASDFFDGQRIDESVPFRQVVINAFFVHYSRRNGNLGHAEPLHGTPRIQVLDTLLCTFNQRLEYMHAWGNRTTRERQEKQAILQY